MKNFLFIFSILIILSSNLAKSQTKSEICKNMGKVKIIFTNTLTSDSLDSIKIYLFDKGIDFKVNRVSFDRTTGGLRFLKFEIHCLGCGMGGTATLGRDSFKQNIVPWGIYYYHGHSPSFMIGEIRDL